MKTIFKPISEERFEEIFIKNIMSQGCCKNSDGTWSCDEDLFLDNMDLPYIPVKFKKIKGDFDCNNNKLSSFKNFPEKIGGNFNCSYNNFTSLDNFPKVKGKIWNFPNPWKDKDTYKQAFIKMIKSLGCEEKTDGSWSSCNDSLYLASMNLPYFPVKFKEIKGDFDCFGNKLTSFENFPDIINGNLYIANNHIPEDLEYPGKVYGAMYR